jgi:beta-glucanase (GH16 family)
MMLMLINLKTLALLLTFLVGGTACETSTEEDLVQLPSNLEVSVEYLQNGQVAISFDATNANFYKVGYGLPNQLPMRVEEKVVTFGYQAPGTYTVTVQAHTTEADFISATQEVVITSQMLGQGIPETGFESPLSYDGYSLVWQDEFEGSALSADWVYEIGDGCPNLCGWGNNELQYYRRENTTVKDGYLIIEAKRQEFGGKNYTSTRLKTQGKQSFTFGRIDIRAVLPKGQGIWPAFWMLGESITEINWPASGEIDIMEMVGGSANGRNNTVHGTIHYDENGTYRYTGGQRSLPEGIFNDQFHVFSIIWDAEKIIWLLDDVEFHREDIRPAFMDEFRKPFFLLVNLAVGGNWPGSPDASTIFPQQLVVDYIRVFQPNEGE